MKEINAIDYFNGTNLRIGDSIPQGIVTFIERNIDANYGGLPSARMRVHIRPRTLIEKIIYFFEEL